MANPIFDFLNFANAPKEMEHYRYLALVITLSGFEEQLHNAARALAARLLQVCKNIRRMRVA